MKIYTCLLTEAANVWHREMIGSLQDMGHQVVPPHNIGLNDSWCRLEAGCWSFRHREELSARLLQDVRQTISKQGLDLFLAYFFEFQFNPEIFKEIEKWGVPTVLFYCDNLTTPAFAEKFSKYFTLNWVPERKVIGLYQKQNCNYIYLPMAANPNLDRPLGLEEKREMVFIGGRTPYRRWLLGSLMSKGLPIEIYGNHWHNGQTYYKLDGPPQKKAYNDLSFHEKMVNYLERRKISIELLLRYGVHRKTMQARLGKIGKEFENVCTDHAFGPVTPQRLIELYSESRVTLGVNHYVDPGCTDLMNLTYSKARDFEAPMSGACYLTQYTKELDRFYPEPDTIMTYRSVDELCEKAGILLKDKLLRDKMRKNARQFCLEHHTWQHRFRALFEKLGLPV